MPQQAHTTPRVNDPMNFATRSLALVLLCLAPLTGQQLIGFEEAWALADDRAKVLAQLVPGTQDHFYYHCRHYQDLGQFDKVEPQLKLWIQRHGRSARVVEIENRQALLTFETSPEQTLAFLRQRLGVRLDHQRQLAAARRELPSRIDPAELSAQAFARRARARKPGSTSGFIGNTLPGLLRQDLEIGLLRELLNRLERADIPGLSRYVLRELSDRHSPGFGRLRIHNRMFLSQLDELAQARPNLLGNRSFVDQYLRRLQPSADRADLGDPELRARHLARLRGFVDRLPPSQNSLKAHVIYHQLVLAERQGRVDPAQLLAYLRLPRRASYVHPDYLRRQVRGTAYVSFGQRFNTGLGPIRQDGALVGRLLRRIFVGADNYSAFSQLLRERYLRRQFAEAKILAGVGDMDRWYQMLDDPAYYEQLRQRVDLEFVPELAQRFSADEEVVLELEVKNVPSLLVKVFEIQALNYYRQKNQEVDARIDLDGLIANKERSFKYTEPPLRRVRRRFEFPELSRPGIYVVEFIGNGMSSRAVVHKGQSLHSLRSSAAGQVVTVRDATGRPVAEAELWFGARRFVSDAAGEVVLPFSTQPGNKSFILRKGRICSLRKFRHLGESYELRAGIHVDREALRARGRAKILCRPQLLLNGEPASLALLEQLVLHVSAKDAEGVEVRLDVRDPKLSENAELVHDLQIPPGLRHVQIHLAAKVARVSQPSRLDLRSRTEVFRCNGIDATAQTASPLLGRSKAGYHIDLLGKNGEAKPGRALRLSFSRLGFAHAHTLVAKTDARGRITLGPLEDIAYLQVSGLPKSVGYWYPSQAQARYPRRIQAATGESLRVPYMGRAQALRRDVAALIERRGGQDYRDAYEHLALEAGYLRLDKLPAGDYRLELKESGAVIAVQVSAGPREGGWVLGRERLLKASDPRPLQLQGMRLTKTSLQVQLQGSGAETRVHLLVGRYQQAYPIFAKLGLARSGGGDQVLRGRIGTSYHSGRRIGDEYRYILERRLAKKYPGNMLPRPGLILNPWTLEDADWNTSMGLRGGAGGRFGGRRGGARRPRTARASGQGGGRNLRSPESFANLSFLAEGSVLLPNLRPDAAGRVEIPLAQLGRGQIIRVLAVDGEQSVSRSMVRTERPLRTRARQLQTTLALDKPLSEQRRIEFVPQGGAAVIQATDSTRAEVYDSLRAVHRLFRSLSGNADLDRFAFLLDWPKLDLKRKRELYEDFACHELHVFLHEKDPAFFKAAVAPLLRNKLNKTFIDHWLLGDPLQAYLEPWAFGRLNVVEKILLARRLGADTVRAHLGESFARLDRDPAQLARLFDSLLKAQGLEGKARGLGPELAKLKELQAYKRGKADGKDKAGGEGLAFAPSLRSASKKVRGRRSNRRAESRPAEEVVESEEEVVEEEDADSVESAFDSNQWNKAIGLGGKRADRSRLRRLAADLERRKQVQALYRGLKATKPLVEHNYWYVRHAAQRPGLVRINGFWHDFAGAAQDRPFFSAHLAEAAGSLAEMLLALSFLDLPFESAEHATELKDGQLTLKASAPLLLARCEVVPSKPTTGSQAILCSQNYYRLDEPQRQVGNRRVDAYLHEEFLIDVAYGCRVVVTNTSSTPVELDLLLQIPQGAIPVQNGFVTKGMQIQLGAYATRAIEYAFYFPAPGTLSCYPVQVTRAGQRLATAEALVFRVLRSPSKVDAGSWKYVSQNGSAAQVLAYLDGHNLQRVDLGQILWRLGDRGFYQQLLQRLRSRHVYDNRIWAYSLKHGVVADIREFLRHQDRFVDQCGPVLESSLLAVEPVARQRYEHMEFEPLVNGRAHRNGKHHKIFDRNLARQYRAFTRVVGARARLRADDWLQACYYLLLQDRIEDALRVFAKVEAGRLSSRLQYDYLRAYLDFFDGELGTARQIAARYRDYPVLRWRKRFARVAAQIAEIEGGAVAQVDPEDRTDAQTAQAAAAPALELAVENQQVKLQYQNVASCELRYYAMDVEFLFSSQPFVQQSAGSFAFIRPNLVEQRLLAKDRKELSFALPAQFRSSNVLVEVEAGGVVRRQTYFSRSMQVAWMENQGQIKITAARSGRPLKTVYVKVFARMADGRVRFFKDGYTDLRGRFDYASLSAKEAAGVKRFSVLVLSDDHGAEIRELAPPAQ